MLHTIERKMLAGFAIVFFTLLAISVTSFGLNVQRNEMGRWITHTQQVLDALEAFRRNLRRNESFERELLQHSALDQQPMRPGVAEIQADLDLLRSLTADNPVQQTNIVLLQTRVQERLLVMKRVEGLICAKKFDAAQQMAFMQGAASTRTIFTTLGEMVLEEHHLLTLRIDRLTRFQARIEIAYQFLRLFMLTILIFVYIGVRQTARSRQKAHERVDALVRAIPDLIYRINKEGICIDAAADKEGGIITNKDCIGKHLRDVLPQEVANLFIEGIQQAHATGELQLLEYELPKKGAISFREARLVAGTDGEVVFIVRDVTEQKRTLKALHEALTLQQAILGSANYSLISTDPDGIILTFNHAAERMLGYWEEEIVGKTTPAPFHDVGEMVQRAAELSAELGRTIEPGFEVFVAKARSGIPDENEWTYIRKDGSRFPVLLSATALFDERGEITGFLGIASDISERKAAEETLKKSEASLIEAQQVARCGNWEFDIVTQEIRWSQMLFELTGCDPAAGVPPYEEAIGMYHEEDHALLVGAIGKAVGEGIPYELDLRIPLPDGDIRWCHASGRPVTDAEGKIIRLVGTLTDITERKQAEFEKQTLYDQLEQNLLLIQNQSAEQEAQRIELEQTVAKLNEANAKLEALALTDGLTGIYNHRAFREKLLSEFERSKRYNTALSVVLLDVDKFKTYNDAYGHPEGDTVLKTVANALREAGREVDFVARYGGEEFVIILPETDAQGAKEAAERFRQAIEQQDWTLRPVTASFGVSTLNLTTEVPQDLVDAADKALYASKEGGRNRVTHHTDLQALLI